MRGCRMVITKDIVVIGRRARLIPTPLTHCLMMYHNIHRVIHSSRQRYTRILDGPDL